jgi:hypothetical protein
MFKPEFILQQFHAEQLTQHEAEVLLCCCDASDIVANDEALAMVRQIDGVRFVRLAAAIHAAAWDSGK